MLFKLKCKACVTGFLCAIRWKTESRKYFLEGNSPVIYEALEHHALFIYTLTLLAYRRKLNFKIKEFHAWIALSTSRSRDIYRVKVSACLSWTSMFWCCRVVWFVNACIHARTLVFRGDSWFKQSKEARWCRRGKQNSEHTFYVVSGVHDIVLINK